MFIQPSCVSVQGVSQIRAHNKLMAIVNDTHRIISAYVLAAAAKKFPIVLFIAYLFLPLKLS